MPAGTSWTRYFLATGSAMLSMFAGAQVVHVIYHPLEDLKTRVEREKKLLKEAQEASAVTGTSTSSS